VGRGSPLGMGFIRHGTTISHRPSKRSSRRCPVIRSLSQAGVRQWPTWSRGPGAGFEPQMHADGRRFRRCVPMRDWRLLHLRASSVPSRGCVCAPLFGRFSALHGVLPPRPRARGTCDPPSRGKACEAMAAPHVELSPTPNCPPTSNCHCDHREGGGKQSRGRTNMSNCLMWRLELRQRASISARRSKQAVLGFSADGRDRAASISSVMAGCSPDQVRGRP
jgi:hypothetical protein